MPGLRSADSYRTWADLRDVLFEIVSAISSLHKIWLGFPEGLCSVERVDLLLYFAD